MQTKTDGPRQKAKDVPILLLAAGMSRRMGGIDKLMQPVDGTPLLRRAATIALATGHPLTVTLPARPHPRFDALSGLDAQLLPVPDASEGINASLRAGLKALKDAPAVMILLADLPDLQTAHLAQIFVARHENPGCVVWRGSTLDGQPGHPTLIDRSLFAAICDLRGDVGAQPVLKSADTCLLPLPGTIARLDLDTPEAWDRWRHANNAKPPDAN